MIRVVMTPLAVSILREGGATIEQEKVLSLLSEVGKEVNAIHPADLSKHVTSINLI